MATKQLFLSLGSNLAGKDLTSENIVSQRRFRSLFGISASACALLWSKLLSSATVSEAQPKHLLWALYFLRNYNTEHQNAGFCGVDEKTLRRWVWYIVKDISRLQIVSYSVLFTALFQASHYATDSME